MRPNLAIWNVGRGEKGVADGASGPKREERAGEVSVTENRGSKT